MSELFEFSWVVYFLTHVLHKKPIVQLHGWDFLCIVQIFWIFSIRFLLDLIRKIKEWEFEKNYVVVDSIFKNILVFTKISLKNCTFLIKIMPSVFFTMRVDPAVVIISAKVVFPTIEFFLIGYEFLCNIFFLKMKIIHPVHYGLKSEKKINFREAELFASKVKINCFIYFIFHCFSIFNLLLCLSTFYVVKKYIYISFSKNDPK